MRREVESEDGLEMDFSPPSSLCEAIEGNPSLLLSLTISIVLLLLIRIIFEGEEDIVDDIVDGGIDDDIDEADVDTDG